MKEVKVNFLATPKHEKPKTGLFFFGRAFGAMVAVGAILASMLSFSIASRIAPDASILDSIPVVSEIRGFLGIGSRAMKTGDDGRTNILILGVGGPGHEAPQLSDTMLFLSLDRKQHQIGMISIPRDLVVNVPDMGERKINSANAYGEEKGFGEGPKVASKVVEDVFGKPIQYYIRVDFTAFVKMIDDVGGIDVNVARAFTDNMFPNDENGVQSISFAAGVQHMDGTTALRYARSRHGSNGEGSDFARSARQQKILATLKDKVFSRSTLLSPTKINAILHDVKSHVNTNMTTLDIIALANEFRTAQAGSMVRHVLIPGENSPLYETVSDGAYVILPKAGDWSELHAVAQNIFDPVSTTALVVPAEVRVEVQNGTDVTGLARRIAGLIAKNGYTVARITNATERGYHSNIIYDLSRGSKPKEFAKLKKLLKAEERKPQSDWVFTPVITPTDGTTTGAQTAAPALDFLVIVGEEPLAINQ